MSEFDMALLAFVIGGSGGGIVSAIMIGLLRPR